MTDEEVIPEDAAVADPSKPPAGVGGFVLSASLVALVVAAFLPWYTATLSHVLTPQGTFKDITKTVNGWQVPMPALWTALPIVLGVAMALITFSLGPTSNAEVDSGKSLRAKLLTVIGMVAAVIIMVRISIEGPRIPIQGLRFPATRAFGLAVADLGALGLAYAGFSLGNRRSSGGSL